MIRIELMRSNPVVRRGEAVAEVTGRPRELFRLLVLRDGQTVTKESIAQLRGSYIDRVAGKIRDLRDELPDWVDPKGLIVSDRALGWRANLSECSIDAKDFRATIERITRSTVKPLTQPISQDAAHQEVKELREALGLWSGNPADGLPHEEGLEATFDNLKASAKDRLVVSQLYTKDPAEIREAIIHMQAQARTGEAGELTWALLLLAYDALGLVVPISNTINEISKTYRDRIPSTLQRTISDVNSNSDFQNPFREEAGTASARASHSAPLPKYDASQQENISALCEMLGITTASRLRLLDSNLTPVACIRRTKLRLNFSGVLASKWVMEPGVRSEFDQLLTRLDANGGEARFMMINPNGEGYRRLVELRKNQISLDSVIPLRALAAAHPSLQVRAFNNLPSFRIVVIDDDVVSFSPYRLAADAYVATERGWEAPHVVLDPIAQYPLSEAFQLLFNETWSGAIPLEEI